VAPSPAEQGRDGEGSSRPSRMYKLAARLYRRAVRDRGRPASLYIQSVFLYIRTSRMYRKIVRLYRHGVRECSRRAALYRFLRDLYIRAGREGIRRRRYTVGGCLYIPERRRSLAKSVPNRRVAMPRLSQAEHIQERCRHFTPAMLGKPGDPRTKQTSLYRANPLRFQDARRRNTLAWRQKDLPRESPDLTGKRNDRDLVEGGQNVLSAEDEDRPTLVGGRETKPADVSPLDQGNSASPSSSIGP
jgi:hypothetical protein